MGYFLDAMEHPNLEIKRQNGFVVQMDDYVHLVPFVEIGEDNFLKTIIPSRNATKKY